MPDDHAQRCSDCLSRIDDILIEYLRAGRRLRLGIAAGFVADCKADEDYFAALVTRMHALREGCQTSLDAEKRNAIRLGVGPAAWRMAERAYDRDEAETRAG